MRSSGFSADVTMEHWQFLIQKQGDRSWDSLESPNVKILEGKYRVVARSNLTNVDVEVRVTHYSSLEIPPKRRVQKRSRRTNAEGLMAVMPFTYLQPGLWELQCSGDLMSNLFGQPWQYSIQLQVLPSTEKEDAIINQPVSPVWLQGQTAEQILQHLVELVLPACDPVAEDEIIEDSPPLIPELPLLLSLEQENYIASWGQILSIDGCVESPETWTLQKLLTGELRLELRSPQSLEILAQTRQTLLEKLLPFSIKSSIEIPADCELKLILGEISLYGILAPNSETTLLASQSFTITADITQLLATSTPATATELEPATTPQTKITPEPSVKLDLELFNIVKSQKIAQLSFTEPTPDILPPLITRSHKSANFRSPQLPKFPQKQTPVAVCEPPTQKESLKTKDSVKAEKMATMDTSAIVLASATPTQVQPLSKEISFAIVKRRAKRDSTFPFLRRIKNLPGDLAPETSESRLLEESDHSHSTGVVKDTPQLATTPDNSLNDSVAVVVQRHSELLTVETSNMSPLIRKWMYSHGYTLPEPIDVEYEDYDLCVTTHEEISEQETLSPIEAETPEVEKAEQQETTEQFPLPPSSPLPLPPPPSPFRIRQFKTPPAWLAREIVVDDTDDHEKVDDLLHHEEEIPVAIAPTMIEALPTPQLYVPEGELISGKFVKVRVQLDCVRPNVAIKLWVKDCQTRCILDGPCLLTSFLPTASGLEVIDQIYIPLGCLEVRIEAIAVDTTNQHESHKTTLIRNVIPEDLPTLQLDELLDL
ncbi:MAG: hypothetical protein KME28_02550 [Pelatocladus maniniholoensis HA4357-MV3]|jgi:hypothetical protein|uniref:Uncharacterized protein n=1 Tax=Pelatocladus maniniholoensis HA4357-MV3 TaxID=1117104 RepID=A0A9E3H458_9NOST|nr:hypothetical protein [Pelatocladus maniniholoensis HA4357-MV3]